MQKPHEPVQLTGVPLGAYRHSCAFFQGIDAVYRTCLRLKSEDRRYVHNTTPVLSRQLSDQQSRQSAPAGIDASVLQRCAQLALRYWPDIYPHDGSFDRDRLNEIIELAQQQGDRWAPIAGHEEAAAGDWLRDLLEYECRLNEILPQSPDWVVCLYDFPESCGDLIFDVIRTHPAVFRGTVQLNPFFVPPDQFLRELSQRRTRSPSASG
jgi:hypothetical protein